MTKITIQQKLIPTISKLILDNETERLNTLEETFKKL